MRWTEDPPTNQPTNQPPCKFIRRQGQASSLRDFSRERKEANPPPLPVSSSQAQWECVCRPGPHVKAEELKYTTCTIRQNDNNNNNVTRPGWRICNAVDYSAHINHRAIHPSVLNLNSNNILALSQEGLLGPWLNLNALSVSLPPLVGG